MPTPGVTPREGRVNRNDQVDKHNGDLESHAPRGACE